MFHRSRSFPLHAASRLQKRGCRPLIFVGLGCAARAFRSILRFSRVIIKRPILLHITERGTVHARTNTVRSAEENTGMESGRACVTLDTLHRSTRESRPLVPSSPDYFSASITRPGPLRNSRSFVFFTHNRALTVLVESLRSRKDDGRT